MAAVSFERRIEGEGTSEANWQAWLLEQPPQIIELDHVLPASARLMVVAPHPDDEVLACGGLLAMHAERGGKLGIIALTDGEASHGKLAAGGALSLAATRRAESAAGLAQLGVAAAVERLAIADGEVSSSIQRLQQLLQSLLREHDVVVSTWRHDGHPDHEAAGAAAQAACAAVGARLLEAPIWMWHWAVMDDQRVPWPSLRALALSPQVLQRKLAALAMHRSQLAAQGPAPAPVLGDNIVARAQRRFEYFFV